MKNKKIISILLAVSITLVLNVSPLCAMADNVESNNNGIVEDVKQPVILEKCSEQLMNTMQNGADTFEVQIAYTDISKVKLNAEINKKVSEYRTNLESEGLTATEIAEKCSEYRKSLNEELIYTVRLERAEQILADIGVDVDSAECAKKTATINCTLNIEQITKAVENELVYGIALISELPEPEGPGEVVIPMETVIPTETVTTTVPTTDSEDTVTTTTTAIESDEEIKPTPSTEKCSEQLMNAMQNGADTFEVQIAYTDISTVQIYAEINKKVSEYRTNLESEGLAATEIAEKCSEYRKSLNEELIYTVRLERAEQILADIGVDVDSAECAKKTATINCTLNIDQITKAVENELVYGIALISELPEPEGPGEVVIPTETVTTTVLTTDSEDTVTTTTTTAVSQVMISDGVKKAMNEQADVAVYIRYNDNSIAIFDDAKAKAAEYIATLDPNDYDKKLEEIEEEYRNNLYNTNIKAERETRTATILETLNISADEVKCEEKNPVISCVLSSEQLNIAKENELIAEIVLQSEYESVEHFIAGVPSDVTSEDELPQTGYSNIYKVLTGIASAMTIAGATMIARSKKKDEE